MPKHQGNKRRKIVIDDLLKEKAQNLPLICVETIFKFTQTFKLIRLLSNAYPLPGAFWNFGLNAVLRKRLPLSLGEENEHHMADDPTIQAIFDAAGAKLARIKRLEAFCFSPLCALIENATTPACAILASRILDRPQLYVVNAGAILAHLSNVTDLSLDVCDIRTPDRFMEQKDFLDSSNLRELLPQLSSFSIVKREWLEEGPVLELTLTGFMREMRIGEMCRLRRLRLPVEAFSGVMKATSASMDLSARQVLSGLDALDISQGGPYHFGLARLEMLQFVARCSPRLSTLFLLVQGDFRAYLAAFHALPGLATLGLYLRRTDLKGLTFDESETICSVSDLRLLCSPDCPRSDVYAIASLFPSVKAVAFQCSKEGVDMLDFVREFCTEARPSVVKTLRCFVLGEHSRCPSERLLEFVGTAELPEAVDLSRIVFDSLSRDASLLSAIYRAMQCNSTRTLLLCGPVHHEALARLQCCLVVSGEDANVTAWKDRDLGEQMGSLTPSMSRDIAPETDIIIVGRKVSGRLLGEQFTLRVFHRAEKRGCIFE